MEKLKPSSPRKGVAPKSSLISGDCVFEADAELNAVLRDAEQAAHTILDASEALLSLSPDLPDLEAQREALVMRIFEACAFQDLVGQRVHKIKRLISHADIQTAKPREADPLLNGPALNGPEVSQDMIDQMLMGSEF